MLCGKFGLSIKDKPNLEWDINDGTKFTVFLDVKFKFGIVDGLCTDVNIKATDARSYLNFESFHPTHTFPSIIYSQMLRYRRIINSEELLQTRLNELGEYFVLSGYPKKMVNLIKVDVCKRTRTLEYKPKDDEPPFPVTWITTYTPIIPQIKDVIADANKALCMSETWKGESRPIGLVNKRAPNLGDKLFKRRKFALAGHKEADLKPTGTIRCTGEEVIKRGRKCKGCRMMSGKSSITSNANNNNFHTPNATCKSKMVIYAAECRTCKKQYIGRTVQELRSRINGHRGWMGKTLPDDYEHDNADEASLANHLKSEHKLETPDQFDENFTFTVVQISQPQNLASDESDWIAKLQTLQPFGLNVAKPYGISERLLN